MTISEYISNFLKQYKNIKIDTNHVGEGSDKYGLYKTAAREREKHLDGSSTITEYYTFFAFQNSMSEDERKEDDEWLEDLTYWADDYDLWYNYPTIDGGRMVTDITITGSPAPFVDDNNGITYQLTLSIKYEREGTANV